MASKKLKIGIIACGILGVENYGRLMSIADISIITESSVIKESEIDLILIPDNIGINPYNSLITGWDGKETNTLAHRILAKHLGNAINSEIKILALGDGAVNLYASLGMKVHIDPIVRYYNIDKNESVDYSTDKTSIVTFVYKNCYGMLEDSRDMWERVILDCFNDSGSAEVMVTNPVTSPPGNTWE